MGKRLKRSKCICSCISPHSSPCSLSPRSAFSWYEDDIWIEIAKYLDGMSVMMLATTCNWFYKLLTEDYVWKISCLCDLGVPDPGNASFKWKELYASAFDGSHSYSFHQQETHIDWMRIGAFFLESPAAVFAEKITCPPKISATEAVEKMLSGSCVLTNIKSGIWIADLHLVRCTVCDLNTCGGRMQILDARHLELFLNKGYHNGSWNYAQMGSHETKKYVNVGAIFDLKHLQDRSTAEVLDAKSWVEQPNYWQAKWKLTPHAVAVNTNLQKIYGVHVKYHVMRAGPDGEIVSIRVSHHL